MNSIISKNRWWRIELCGGVQSGCDEGGEHLIPLKLLYLKFQRTITFAPVNRFNSFLQRWKALGLLHSLGYLHFYHMLQCMVVATAVSFDVQS